MDDYTTDECEFLNGQFFRVDDPNIPLPPLHHNCRSVLIPVFTGEEPWSPGGWTTLEQSKEWSGLTAPGFGGT
jgi:uncharacterized protein with gpF-like domain